MQVTDTSELVPPKILPETHFSAGMLYESQGLFDKAIVQYRKATAANHRYVDAYHRLALLLSRTKRHGEACTVFAKAVEIDANNSVLRNNHGYELLLTQRWVDAAHAFQAAIDLDPGFNRARINLGIARSRIGMYEESLASFREVLPEPDAYYNLGLMHRTQGRYRLAAGCFQHVLLLNGSFTAARAQLAELSPILAATTEQQTDPLLDELFAGSSPAPVFPDETQVSINLDVETPWSEAEMLSYVDLEPQVVTAINTMCPVMDEASESDIFAMTHDIMSTPGWEENHGAWESVISGSFSLSFREDQFQLTEFLSIIDNDYRCYEEMENADWDTEVFTKGTSPVNEQRPTMSATVIEGPPANMMTKPSDRAKSVTPRQNTKPKRKQNQEPTFKPRASIDTLGTKTGSTYRSRHNEKVTNKMPHESVATHRTADLQAINSVTYGPLWALHTTTAGGSLDLTEADEATKFVYGSHKPHQGLAVNKAPRETLPYRILDSQQKKLSTKPSRRVAAKLATMRELKARLEVVQNEIHCLDARYPDSTSDR